MRNMFTDNWDLFKFSWEDDLDNFNEVSLLNWKLNKKLKVKAEILFEQCS